MTPNEVRLLIPSWIENSSIHVCVVTDMAGNYLYVNQLFKRRFSFITDDFIGMSSTDTYHPDDFEKSLQAVMECFANPNKVVNLQLRKPNPIPGEYHWENWEFSAFKNPKGEVVGIFCLGHGTNETEDFEFTQKKYLQKTQAVLQNLTDGFLILDNHWKIIALNQTIANVLQISPTSYVGKNIWEIVTANNASSFLSNLSKSLKEGSILTIEEYFSTVDNWYSIIIFPNPEGLTVYFQDITTQKRTVTELALIKKQLYDTSKMAKIGGWEYDVLKAKSSFTEETYRIHEVDSSFTPTIRDGISFYHPDYQEKIKDAFFKLLREGKAYDLELKFVTAQKNEIWVRTMGKAIYENGKIIKLLGTLQNIDDRKKQKEALKLSQERLQLLADNVPGAIFQYILHPDGSDEIPFINIGSRQVWELSPEEVMKDTSTLWSTILPEYLPSLQASILKSAKNQSFWQGEYQIKTPSGKLKWIEAKGTPQGKLGNGAYLWHSIALDITEKKSRTQELQKTKSLLDATNEIAQIGGWEYDIESDRLFWTEETYRIHELDQTSLPDVNKGISFYHPEHQPIIQEAFETLLDTGEAFDLELKFITAQQNEIWVRAMGKAVYNNGKIEKLIGTFQDIDEKKKQEEKIRDSQQKLSAILNSAIDSNILIDLDYKVLACNRIAKEETKVLMGKEMQEGDNFKDFLAFFDQRISDVFYDAFNRAINGENFEIEEEIFFEGFSIWYRYKYDVVYDTSGDIIGVSLTSTNIDERKKAEEKVLQQNEILKEIAWIQSHKVRHPVANILGLVDLIKNDKTAGKELQKQFFDYLLEATHSLDEIIHEIVKKSEELDF